jgi:hypothetical protein
MIDHHGVGWKAFLAADRVSVGDFWTGRFQLVEGESVTGKTAVFKRSALGGWQRGMLYLTSERMIYLPGILTFRVGRRVWFIGDVRDVRLESGGIGTFPHGCTMVMDTDKGKHQFGFGGLPSEGQRDVTASWVKAIRQWANLCA